MTLQPDGIIEADAVRGTREVILVDIFDRPIGTARKLEAHQKGLLHRAFSVFVHDSERMLIQRRAAGKYHSAGLWCNACCSHQRPGEGSREAAERRLYEETGLKCASEEAFSFVYRAKVGAGLIEYEFDHVFIGRIGDAQIPDFDRSEIERMEWVGFDELASDLTRHPERYAPWFITALPMALRAIIGE